MTGEIKWGLCDCCGKEKQLLFHREKFSFPCECHSPVHFIIHSLCEDCYQTYREKPDKLFVYTVSVDTFNLFLKAHAHYASENRERDLTFRDLEPTYIIQDKKPMIQIVSTYDTLCYLSKIYTIYQNFLKEKESE